MSSKPLAGQKKSTSQPVVDEIKTFIMTKDHPAWFNTPALTYLSMKKEFLGKTLDWGEFGTEKQVIALASLLGYFKKTRNLADQFPQLSEEITVENKNMLIQRTLLLPEKLYEQLLLAVIEGVEEEYQSIWEQPSSVTLAKIERFLERRMTGCLAAYQSQVWSDPHSSQNYPADETCDDFSEASEDISTDEMSMARTDLRKLRNKIYARIYSHEKVYRSLRQYHNLTEDFIARYDSLLTVEQTESLRKRVNIARNAAKAAFPKVRPIKQSSKKRNIKPRTLILTWLK